MEEKTTGIEKKDMLKTHIDYYIKWIKTDLENTMQTLQPHQQIIYLNTQLEKLYLFGLITQNTELCTTIEEYRQEQSKQENLGEKAQRQITTNAKNIYDSILQDL